MKALQRLPYVELVSELDWEMCAFCKYHGSDCCCDYGCTHPLENRLNIPDNDIVSDCWGFRPSHPISDVADIVGICLEYNWTQATWWTDKGVLKIAGRGDNVNKDRN